MIKRNEKGKPVIILNCEENLSFSENDQLQIIVSGYVSSTSLFRVHLIISYRISGVEGIPKRGNLSADEN